MDQEKSARVHTQALSCDKDYYEILHLGVQASSKDVREAYFQLKNTYHGSNQALYSLVGAEEANANLIEIEEAYSVLSNDKTRSVYDAGRLAMREPDSSPARAADPAPCNQPETASRTLTGASTESSLSERDACLLPYASYSVSPQTLVRRVHSANASKDEVQKKIAELVAEGDPTEGSFYKNLRLAVGVDREELQEHIKISIGYIDHLEQNRFDLLPQPVYVKGFLKSYLKYLGVPHADNLVKAYSERFSAWFESKNL